MHGHDISNWKEDDTVFVETHSFSAMLKKVRNQPFMTFVGAPGSGKTATVRHIALKLQEEGYEIVQLRDIKDVETYCDPYNPQVFVIDDVLGMFDLVISEFHLLCKYQNILRGPIMSKTKTLMTCREAVFKNEVLSNCFWSKQENVIQMHDHANAISYKDRHKLLLKYNLDDPDSILQINPQFLSKMFPKLCAVFSKRKEYMKTQEGTLFSFPIPCILEELDEMKSRNKIHYASLVLMMANERKLSKEDLDNTDLSTCKNSVIKKKDSLLTACEVSYVTESYEFISALIEMNGIYTKNSGSGFSFINNLMFEITAKHFGCLFPKLILQCMSSSYIANYVKLRKSDIEEHMSKDKTLEDKMRIDKKVSQKLKAMNELCILLQESEYPLFASRLYGKIRNLEVNVFENEALKHPVVLHAFIEKMKRTPFQKLYFLYFSKLKVTEKLRSCVCEQEKYSPNEVVNIEIQCLLLMDEYRRSPLRISVGAICYVLYYGHHQILQYILDQLREKGKVDNLFKNAYNENIRFYRHVLATSDLSGESDDSSDNEGDYQTTFTDTYSESDIESMSAAQLRLLNLATYSGDIATVHLLMTYVDKEILHATGSNISNLIFKPLHIACKFGYSKIATSLVKAGCDVNLATNFLSTPLIIACDGGHMCIVQMLVREGADVNLNNKYKTPLVAACSKGYISIVQELIKRGAHVNLSSRDAKYEEEIGSPFDLMFDSWERSFSTGGLNAMFEDVFKPDRFPNERNQTPLTAACYNGYLSIVQVLTEAGADVNQSDGHQNPLIAACLNGHLSIVKTLLKAGADINQLIDHQNPLIAACFNGHLNIVETLLKAGFDVNQRKGHPNPLIAACAQGYSSIVETLLKAGYDANQTDGHKTPLLAACLNGHLSTVETLLEAGSNINHTCDRDTPLKAACLRKYFDIVHRLLKAGVKIIWDVYMYELLTAACFEGHLLVVRELINARIDVNQSDGRQKPLIAACLKGHINVVEELIKAGANVNQSIGKETPLTAATTAGHLNIVERLIKAGADVNLKDKETTPIKAAYDKGHLAIVEKLKEAGADVSK